LKSLQNPQRKVLNVKKFLLATFAATLIASGAHALDYAADNSSILRSLPAHIQARLEEVRSRCQEDLTLAKAADEEEHAKVTLGKSFGLTPFTLSGTEAVMVNYLDVCDGKYVKYVNGSTWGSYYVAIYIRSGTTWREVFLSPVSSENVFLSIDGHNRFKAMVVSIRKDKRSPERDVIMKWNGTKFTYKPL
jgi:hypothetical protein